MVLTLSTNMTCINGYSTNAVLYLWYTFLKHLGWKMVSRPKISLACASVRVNDRLIGVVRESYSYKNRNTMLSNLCLLVTILRFPHAGTPRLCLGDQNSGRGVVVKVVFTHCTGCSAQVPQKYLMVYALQPQSRN